MNQLIREVRKVLRRRFIYWLLFSITTGQRL
jgi:hypothetical protein